MGVSGVYQGCHRGVSHTLEDKCDILYIGRRYLTQRVCDLSERVRENPGVYVCDMGVTWGVSQIVICSDRPWDTCCDILYIVYETLRSAGVRVLRACVRARGFSSGGYMGRTICHRGHKAHLIDYPSTCVVGCIR